MDSILKDLLIKADLLLVSDLVIELLILIIVDVIILSSYRKYLL